MVYLPWFSKADSIGSDSSQEDLRRHFDSVVLDLPHQVLVLSSKICIDKIHLGITRIVKNHFVKNDKVDQKISC
jgi:hypothetical protein